MIKKSILCLFIVFACAASIQAETYKELKDKYPSNTYIVGIAEVPVSGDIYKDKRRAEILARLEIAKQIRIRIKETTVDFMCEGEGKVLFANVSECRNQFVMVVEETVDEMIDGSKIVAAGSYSDRGVYYAVAVLRRKEATKKAELGVNESIEKAKDYLEKAKTSENGAEKEKNARNARKELLKGIAYEGERSAIEETKKRAEVIFKELSIELNKVK